MLAGVEAPAVMPIWRLPAKQGGRKLVRCFDVYVGQNCAQTSRSLQVLELVRPPMTTIASDCLAKAMASCCLFSVALHIVSNMAQFVHTFLRVFEQFSHSDKRKVV